MNFMKKNVLYILLLICLNVNAQWVSQASGTADNLSAVFFPSTNVGYIASNGYLLKTINGGTSWNTSPGSGMYNGSPLYFISIDTGYSCGFGGVLKTVDGGLTWIDNFPYPNTANCNICFPTSNIGYAITQNASTDSAFTYKTINAGTSWTLMGAFPSGDPISMVFSDAMNGSMIMGGDGIYKTSDGGITWIPKLTTISAMFLMAINFPSATIGYAVGGDSIFKTTDMGETWNPIYFPNSFNYTSVYFTDIDTGYAAGGDGFSTGVIRKTVDGGLTWTLSNTNSYTFYAIHFPNSNTGYACGQSGVIYKYSPTVGINDIEELDGVSIFPNPNTGKFKLSIDNFVPGEKYIVSVLDILGNSIQQTELNSTSEFDISNQAKGIYFVKVESKNGIAVKKIVVE